MSNLPSDPRPDLNPDVTGPMEGDAQSIAREQFAHGLLESLHLDTPAARERRIKTMLANLSEAPIRVSWHVRHWRLVSGVAAAVVFVGLVLLGLPTQQSATAMVQASLEASKTAGDRRYEVRVTPPNQTEIGKDPIGVLDVRDADHVLIRARTPQRGGVIVGRSEKGAWAIRPDGSLDHYPPKQAWPPWVNFGQSTLPMVSIDELMTWLEKSYTLKKLDAATVPAGTGPVCNRISAAHKAGPSPEPARVELWIDAQTRTVRRMELHWNPMPRRDNPDGLGPPGGPGPDGLGRPGRRPPRPDGGPDGEPGFRGPPPGGEPGFDPEIGPNGEPPLDRPPPRRDRPDGQGPRRLGPPDGPLNGPPLGPPNGPLNGPPGGPRDGRRGGPLRPRPEFLGGPPDFDHGRHPPPPRTLVFDLVEGATFTDSWFEAETHMTEPLSPEEEAPAAGAQETPR